MYIYKRKVDKRLENRRVDVDTRYISDQYSKGHGSFDIDLPQNIELPRRTVCYVDELVFT